jgi:hypothetical protein
MSKRKMTNEKRTEIWLDEFATISEAAWQAIIERAIPPSPAGRNGGIFTISHGPDEAERDVPVLRLKWNWENNFSLQLPEANSLDRHQRPRG